MDGKRRRHEENFRRIPSQGATISSLCWTTFPNHFPLFSAFGRKPYQDYIQAGGDLMEINYPKLVTFVSRSILKRAFKSISFNDIGWMDVTMGGLVQLKPISSIHTSGPSLMYGKIINPHTHIHTHRCDLSAHVVTGQPTLGHSWLGRIIDFNVTD